MRVLSNICAPNYLLSADPSVILDRQYHDFDEQAERLTGFDQSYLQLTPGTFSGRFLSCFLGDNLSVHLEHCNQALEQTVAGHSQAITIGVLASEGEPFLLNGSSFDQDGVLVAMPYADLHLRSPVEGAVIAIVIHPDHLRDHSGLSAPAKEWLFAPDFGAQLLNAPQLARRIREDVVQAIQAASFEKGPEKTAQLIGDALLAGVASKLSLEFSGHGASLSRLLSPISYEQFLAGRDAIHKNWNDIHSVDDVLAITRSGRRTLQSSFTSQISLGPLSYHRLLRLHMARCALSDPGQFDVSIGDIAARHEFWSWSQFTKLYQTHFGQLPSDTRSNARAEAPIAKAQGKKLQ
ncbi:helix-turn-helix domain-containing protein [Ruegeria atlantica]|uniref:helix-turn-helix domain-containing protein n=1 Tax=Ruegeria atlantica TaxID=81569 RepID=UPI00147A570F|nr:helix-turn-helix domain-containing protein [Ruegeria atlantica]